MRERGKENGRSKLQGEENEMLLFKKSGQDA